MVGGGNGGSRQYNQVKRRVKTGAIYSLYHFECKFDTRPAIHLYVPGTHHICGVLFRIPGAGERARITCQQTTTMDIFICKKE